MHANAIAANTPGSRSRIRRFSKSTNTNRCWSAQTPSMPADDDLPAITDDHDPVDLTIQLAAFKPYQRFRRYDGYDSQLHRSQSRQGSW